MRECDILPHRSFTPERECIVIVRVVQSARRYIRVDPNTIFIDIRGKYRSIQKRWYTLNPDKIPIMNTPPVV